MKEVLTKEDLLALEIEALKRQLEEYKDLVNAIRNGEVDALAINKNGNHDIFALESTDYVYRVLVENFAEGALNISEHGTIVYANFAFENIIGASTTSVLGENIENIIHPDSKKEFRKLFQKSFSGKSKGELVLLHNGKSVPVYVSLSSLYPRFPGIGIIITDLTEKKKQEDKLVKQKLFSEELSEKIQHRTRELVIKNNLLQQQKDFSEIVLNASMDFIAVFDKDLKYVLINKRVEDYYKLSQDDLIGKGVTDLFPHAKGSIIEKNLKLCLEGNKISDEPYLSPIINRWLEPFYIPIKDEQGATYNALMILRDVTEMYDVNKALERKNKALDESKSFLKQIIDSSVDIILVVNKDLNVMTVNQKFEALLNVKRKDVIGKNIFEINPHVENTLGHECILQALEGKKVKNIELQSLVKKNLRFDTYFIPLIIRKKIKGVIIMSRAINNKSIKKTKS